MEKRVGIVLHKYFYVRFFKRYDEMLNSLTKVGYSKNSLGLTQIIKKMKFLYSSYSSYLKDDEKDTYLFELMEEKLEILNNDETYKRLIKKANVGFSGFIINELRTLNLLHNKYLLEVLEVFGIFVNRFAKNDLFPKLTSSLTDYEREIIWASYEFFYESFYTLNYKLNISIEEFNLLNFNEVYKLFLVYFYGYNYYFLYETKERAKELFKELINLYNDEKFIKIFYLLLNGSVTKDKLNLLEEYKNKFIDLFIELNIILSEDLTKSNIFPKRLEKVVVDETLI